MRGAQCGKPCRGTLDELGGCGDVEGGGVWKQCSGAEVTARPRAARRGLEGEVTGGAQSGGAGIGHGPFWGRRALGLLPRIPGPASPCR